MSERGDDIIQPQTAPLSHLATGQSKRGLLQRLDWRSVSVVVAVLAAVALAYVWAPTPAVAPERTVVPAPAGDDVPATATAADEPLAPFAATQKQLARENAQEALSRFVEHQIQLEESMAVDSWGADALAAAMALAQEGDAQFLKEKFAQALATYDQAVAELQALIDEGERLYRERLDAGRVAIADLEPAEAVVQLEAALLIKPEGADALSELQRAGLLPDIISKMRSAKNHELNARYAQALALYDEVAALDPATSGLAEARASVARAQAGNDLNSQISRGFAALNERRFDAARRAFNAALQLDPANEIAAGGLQQVAEQNDLAIIRRHQRDAEAAMAREAWQEAADAYGAALDLDPNIQFASNGKRAALAHQRAERLLGRIMDAPNKLSSQKLYLDAQTILAEARALEQTGPKLQAAIDTVADLLIQYRDPVDVVLVSDNATDVIVSNVGRLGVFEEKLLTLRPGEYTIRGSQDGCRDIFLKVEVLPGIQPIEVRCVETLARQ